MSVSVQCLGNDSKNLFYRHNRCPRPSSLILVSVMGPVNAYLAGFRVPLTRQQRFGRYDEIQNLYGWADGYVRA